MLRLKHIGRPVDAYDQPRDKAKGKGKVEAEAEERVEQEQEQEQEQQQGEPAVAVENQDDLPESVRFESLPLWTSATTRALRPVFSDPTIASLRALLVEGKDPPPKSDGGWGSRKARVEAAVGNEEEAMNVEEGSNATTAVVDRSIGSGGRGQGRDRGRGRGRGGRGGRGGGRGGGSEQWWVGMADDREVLSQVGHLRVRPAWAVLTTSQ